jgi:hypothetical protein
MKLTGKQAQPLQNSFVCLTENYMLVFPTHHDPLLLPLPPLPLLGKKKVKLSL